MTIPDETFDRAVRVVHELLPSTLSEPDAEAIVRAVLEAIEEPSEFMITAANEMCGPLPAFDHNLILRTAWREMIRTMRALPITVVRSERPLVLPIRIS